MAERYEPGVHRIFYRAANFATGLIIKVYFIDPDLNQNNTITLYEVNVGQFPGLYCFEHNFFKEGSYVAYFYEGSVLKWSQAYSVQDANSGVVNINHNTEKTVIERKGDATFPIERNSDLNEPIDRGH